MSRTRVIYFLSAIVLIIGCFALNTSYSLFVDNDSTQLVETTVPTITKEEVTLSLSSVEVEGTKEYLIKQTITNNNSIPMGFRISATSDSTTYQVQSTKYETDTITKEDGTEEKIYTNYYSYGTVEPNKTEDVYLKVSNTNEDINNIATINFALESDYATLKMDTEEYLANANIDNQTQYPIEIPALPYSDNPDTLTYKLIKKQLDRDGLNNLNGVDSLFSETTDKRNLPIESSFNVPTLTTVTGVETEDVGLYQAEDDYGTSYFYRGANDYNYVNFAGFIWRIVRINGDGSIRLILDGSISTLNRENEDTTAGKTSQFNKGYDNSYIGYMYGTAGSTSYDNTHKNLNSSLIKQQVDLFYENYIENEEKNYHYEKFLGDALFCGDKSLSTKISESSNLGYGTNKTYYAAAERLMLGANVIPTLECAKEASNNYSRYTSNIETLDNTNKNISINNDLSHPIALISADELVMAGAFANTANTSYYLYTPNSIDSVTWKYWATMTPVAADRYGSYVFGSRSRYESLSKYIGGEQDGIDDYTEIRPVINLKSDILWESGDGTKDSPYTVKLNEEA